MNPVWNKEGYCYLQIIRPHLLHTQVWPKNPMVKAVTHFDHSCRKRTAFTLKEVANGQYHVETGQQYAHIGWDYLASLGNSANSTWRVGGESSGGSSLTASILMFNGTNYQNWSRMVSAYLKMQGLWSYVSGITAEPAEVANPGSLHSGATPSEVVTHEKLLKDYDDAKTKAIAWGKEDDKAMGIIALKLTPSMQYLLKKYSKETWENIKKLFDTPGAAGIFVHFRAAINFKMDEKKDPSVQISKLQTAVNKLSANKFEINEKMQAMIVLASLPNGWDSVAATILATNKANDLTLARIMPVLQEEWQRQHSRGEKSVHFARTNIRQGPPRQPWQGHSNYQPQQAGSSNQPAPYK